MLDASGCPWIPKTPHSSCQPSDIRVPLSFQAQGRSESLAPCRPELRRPYPRQSFDVDVLSADDAQLFYCNTETTPEIEEGIPSCRSAREQDGPLALREHGEIGPGRLGERVDDMSSHRAPGPRYARLGEGTGEAPLREVVRRGDEVGRGGLPQELLEPLLMGEIDRRGGSGHHPVDLLEVQGSPQVNTEPIRPREQDEVPIGGECLDPP